MIEMWEEVYQWALPVAAFAFLGLMLWRGFREAGRWTVMNGKGEWLQETDPVLWTPDPAQALVIRTLKEAIDCAGYVGGDAQTVPWVAMVVRGD